MICLDYPFRLLNQSSLIYPENALKTTVPYR